jgi:peptidase E
MVLNALICRDDAPAVVSMCPRMLGRAVPAAWVSHRDSMAGMTDPRQIVAMGGGGFVASPPNPLLTKFVLSLARSPRPRVCFVPTASADSAVYVANVYRGLAPFDCVPSDLALFERSVADLESFILSQDVVFVGGGSTANLLAVWRTHGLDRILQRAWEDGVLLCGVSAGMNCWFEASVTDSFDIAELAALNDGLGFLAGSCCPHYDSEPKRRPSYEKFVAAGTLAEGWAADDGAALVFRGEDLVEVVSWFPESRAYRIQKSPAGVTETALPTRYLG